jgi:hypothetical protein
MTALYGPPTTNALSGAGSPMNDWDERIERALRHGDEKLAQGLREARARTNLAFGIVEPVFIPRGIVAAMLVNEPACASCSRVAPLDGEGLCASCSFEPMTECLPDPLRRVA